MLSLSCSESCGPIDYDIHEAVCCENCLHLGAGLSCCGKEAFTPLAATCCKVNTSTGNDNLIMMFGLKREGGKDGEDVKCDDCEKRNLF